MASGKPKIEFCRITAPQKSALAGARDATTNYRIAAAP
jgi:hypothetical protein